MAQTITVYTTSHRVKARQELKRAGIKPYTPKEFGGLIAANDRPADAAYVHGRIGVVRRDEFARMYGRGGRTSKTQRMHKFAIGDQVVIRRGHTAELTGKVVGIIRSQWYEVGLFMLGKPHVVKIRESDLIRLHPST